MNLQCVECGDMCVSLKSHKHFCKGMEKGQPWLVMQMTGGNVSVWKKSEKFQKWAKGLGIVIPSNSPKKPRL